MNVGVFADKWDASTGMAVVCSNLARQLATHDDIEVYYFGRFGCEKGFVKEPELVHNYYGVKTQGGVWDRELTIQLIKHYAIDLVFTEDDWFSIDGIQQAAGFWQKPFYWLSPIDSVPVHPNGLYSMKKATKVFVPTRGAMKYLQTKGVGST